jgi:hypothetical protein
VGNLPCTSRLPNTTSRICTASSPVIATLLNDDSEAPPPEDGDDLISDASDREPNADDEDADGAGASSSKSSSCNCKSRVMDALDGPLLLRAPNVLLLPVNEDVNGARTPLLRLLLLLLPVLLSRRGRSDVIRVLDTLAVDVADPGRDDDALTVDGAPLSDEERLAAAVDVDGCDVDDGVLNCGVPPSDSTRLS